MINELRQKQIEYGDFQTPLDLAKRICKKLSALGVTPDIIIEPTCGIGAFVEASANQFEDAKQIIGIEVNNTYLDETKRRIQRVNQKKQIALIQGDYFAFNWNPLIKNSSGSLLVIGNYPWVTNSQQGNIGGVNLPKKSNFKNRNGFDAMTGSSNFDISEWMLIQSVNWFRNRSGYLAMLCKTTVARKILNYLHSEKIRVLRSAIYGIDTKYYFNVSVDACLLFCEFDECSHNYDYDVYENLDSTKSERVGHRNGITVRDLAIYERLSDYHGHSNIKWRSGVKHDCSAVMELNKTSSGYSNGLGENIEIEDTYLYPLLKGSDVANGRIDETNRYVLVTQKKVGELTKTIKDIAPRTWDYLVTHENFFNERKSRIYKNNPQFSIFGVGTYTFAPYKIAICSLYKKLEFQLIRPIEGKPVIFDDTVYFLSFNTEQEAKNIFDILSSPLARDFYTSIIFWDEKRPIKISILNSLNLLHFKYGHELKLF